MVMVVVKSPPASAGDIGVHSVPGLGRPLEAGRAAHSSILAYMEMTPPLWQKAKRN